MGAPRRLFTSDQGRTGTGAGPAPDEAVEARRQAGQSCGQRGFRRRWSVLRIFAAALYGAGPGWGQQREQSSAREKVRKNKSKNTCWFIRILLA